MIFIKDNISAQKQNDALLSKLDCLPRVVKTIKWLKAIKNDLTSAVLSKEQSKLQFFDTFLITL